MVDLKMILVLGVDTTTLGSKIELVAARTQVASDPLLADPVIGRGVDEVDAHIENTVKKPLRSSLIDDAHAPGSWTTQPHAAVTQLSDLQACFAEG